MKRFLALLCLLALGTAQAADRVAYVEKQVVRYVGDKPVTVKELVPIVVSDPVVQSVPARSVPATTFRNGDFDPDHQCNRCGRSQYVISGWLPNGKHRHTCSCGNSWYH